MTDGVYVLNDKGDYIFVNSTYVNILRMPKSTLLRYSVYDFLSTGQIDFSISDIVYREKRQMVMFQNVYDTQSYGRQTYQQLVISTPIFNSSGNVQNILAIVRPMHMLNSLYDEANRSFSASLNLSVARTQDEKRDPSIVAESTAMQNILELARTVSGVDSAILVTGESGTGKEVVAQYMHRIGKRKDKPFVVINCAALPASLLEAELFGYEKGAFTGA
jgi:transcriptional regulator with PAS, ATPase and Fis domain